MLLELDNEMQKLEILKLQEHGTAPPPSTFPHSQGFSSPTCRNCLKPGCPGLIDHCETGYYVYYCSKPMTTGKGKLPASPEQTATGKDISNPLKAVHLPKMQLITPSQIEKGKKAQEVAKTISKQIEIETRQLLFHQPETSSQEYDMKKTLERIEENQNLLKLLLQSKRQTSSSHISSNKDSAELEDTATSKTRV